MSKTTAELGNELKKGLALLQALRDEVRVRVHLERVRASLSEGG